MSEKLVQQLHMVFHLVTDTKYLGHTIHEYKIKYTNHTIYKKNDTIHRASPV